jgi:hypothetical protein
MNRPHQRPYTISRPKVYEAKARNKCRICQRAINKGEKYLACYFLDECSHLVTVKGHRGYYPFHTLMKYCKECAVELLKIADKEVHVSGKHKQNVLEALSEMLGHESRFDILKGTAPLTEYLKEHGINEQA